MMKLIGKWSADALYLPGPTDQVIVFLPDGTGVLEVYNWKLCWCETFHYSASGSRISLLGQERFDFDHGTRQVLPKLPSINFTGEFKIVDETDALGKPIEVIEFDAPPAESATIENRFGRVSQDVNSYQAPSFDS